MRENIGYWKKTEEMFIFLPSRGYESGYANENHRNSHVIYYNDIYSSLQ